MWARPSGESRESLRGIFWERDSTLTEVSIGDFSYSDYASSIEKLHRPLSLISKFVFLSATLHPGAK